MSPTVLENSQNRAVASRADKTLFTVERMELPQAADQNNMTTCDRDNL